MKKVLFLLGGLGILGYGLYRYFKTQADLLKQFDWKISGFKIINVSLNELSLSINFLFTSKADIEATIEKMYFDLFLENTNVGFVTEDKSFIVPAHGSTTIPIRVAINPQSVFKNVVDLAVAIAKKLDFKFKLKGFVSVKSGLISTTMPIEYEASLKEFM
jgi:LEA14-like dessication related protein